MRARAKGREVGLEDYLAEAEVGERNAGELAKIAVLQVGQKDRDDLGQDLYGNSRSLSCYIKHLIHV